MGEDRSLSEKQRLRFGWIEACLRHAGQFGVAEKKVYCDQFGLSAGMASRDQAKFLEEFNARAGVEAAEKHRGKIRLTGENGDDKSTIFPVFDRHLWLKSMLGERLASLPDVRRDSVLPGTLRTVVKAIKSRCPIVTEYHSRNGNRGWRRLSPHSLVDVVNRYHVRAWDYEKSQYADFVLSRMVNPRLQEDRFPAYVDNKSDTDWHTLVPVEIRPSDGVDPDSARLDYGLKEGDLRILKIRKALANYMIDDRSKAYSAPVTVRLVE